MATAENDAVRDEQHPRQRQLADHMRNLAQRQRVDAQQAGAMQCPRNNSCDEHGRDEWMVEFVALQDCGDRQPTPRGPARNADALQKCAFGGQQRRGALLVRTLRAQRTAALRLGQRVAIDRETTVGCNE